MHNLHLGKIRTLKTQNLGENDLINQNALVFLTFFFLDWENQ